MINSNRDLLVLFKNQLMTEQSFQEEVECLNEILIIAESSEQFCKTHELVDRNRITSSMKKILKESQNFRLRPFRFLINKN